MSVTHIIRGAAVAILLGTLSGCGMFGNDGGRTTDARTTSSATALPVRREASKVADIAPPQVEVSGDTVVVAGTVRLRGSINPAAMVHVAVLNRYGKQADEYHAKMMETDNPSVMTYRIRFAPVPAQGAQLVVSYQDWLPSAEYSSDYIGSGASGSGGARSARNGGNITTGSGTSNTKSQTYGGPTRGGSRLGKSSP